MEPERNKITNFLLQTLRNMSPRAAGDRMQAMDEARNKDAEERIRSNYGTFRNWQKLSLPEERRVDLLTKGIRGIASRIPGTGLYDKRRQGEVDRSNSVMRELKGKKLEPEKRFDRGINKREVGR